MELSLNYIEFFSLIFNIDIHSGNPFNPIEISKIIGIHLNESFQEAKEYTKGSI
jgi:hypothetical protein